MTLRDQKFERAVRRRVRRAIRESPALRREERRARPTRRSDLSQPIFRGFVTFSFVMSLAKLGSNAATPDAMLGLLTVWCATIAIHYANRLRFHLYGAPEILVLALQPLRDDAIFAHRWRAFTRLSLWLLGDVTGALLVLFWFAQANPVQWITALPCALALWLGTIAIAALFVRLQPGANFGALSNGLFLLVASSLIACHYAPQLAGRLFDGASGVLYAVPPFGWICYVIRESVLGPSVLPLLLLLPVALLAPALQHAKRRLSAHYQLFAAEDSTSFEAADTEPSPALPGATTNRLAGTVDPEQARFIAEAWTRPGSPWARCGLLERWIARWLTPRERDIAEFLTGGSADWTSGLRRSTILVLAAFLAAFSLGPTGLWLCYVGLYFAATSGLPILGTPCVGLSVIEFAGTSFPVYAGLPLGFHEMVRVLLKVGIVRTLAFAPIALAAGTVIGYLAEMDWALGILTAAKIVALLICWQPIVVTLQFSMGTNDTRGPARRSLMLFGTLGFLILAMVAVSAATLFAPIPWAAAGVLAGAAISWSALRLYGRFYNRNTFDLMHGQVQ